MRRLILRPGAIGDCILALPAIQHLTVDYTEVWISTPVVPLIRFAQKVTALASTGIDAVGFGERPVPAPLADSLASFDSIVSWYGSNRDDFRHTLLAINPRCEFLEALPPAGYAGHAATFFCDQVGAPDVPPTLALPAYESRGTIVIHPFSGGARKNWPLDSYRELARKLPDHVEWTVGPEETLVGAKRFDNLLELAGWLRGARLYLGNDSGITHLAAAAGAHTVALFGPSDPGKWAPRGKNVTVLHHEPIAELPVERVARMVNRLLS